MSNHKPLGCLDFLNFIYNGHPEYSLIAVRAPFETTLELRERINSKLLSKG